jgi:hypothetical protein
MYRSLRWLLTAVVLGCGLTGGAVAATASASTSPSGGTVRVWVTPGKGAVDQILLTGVIADHGSATSVNKNGTINKNGQYVRVVLTHGAFKVNAVSFNQALNKVAPSSDKATCTFWGGGSGNVTLFDGTGAYAGITGTVKMTTSFAAILPRYTSGAKKGQCNGNGAPSAQFDGALTGVGKVSF